MFPTSLRWRLPLSYAGIALLAALALGVVLLTTLRSYYAALEHDYLQGNALSIGSAAAQLLSDSPDQPDLQRLLASFAFFSRTRVQILHPSGTILADSGLPQDNSLLSISYPTFNETLPVSVDFIWSVAVDPDVVMFEPMQTGVQIIREDTERELWFDQIPPAMAGGFPYPTNDDQQVVMSVAPSLYGFGIGASPIFDNRRSDQAVQIPIMDSSQQVMGYLRLSEGPAIGGEIVDGVARGWLIASGIAVVFAAGVGWWFSRRLSAPLLNLTHVTSRMAQGDLSARAAIRQQDEIGILARTFNDMAAKVEETVLVLRRFVADAAHEIHTPLTALRTNLELAFSDDNRTFLERALTQVKRLETLTDGLLQLSRIETTADDTRESLDLTALVREMSEFYASQAEQAGLTFHLELPAAPIIVKLHPAQFRSALGNLLDNAVKFTPENGVIKLGLSQKASYVELCVQDTGIGIPADDLPLVFNRFHRGRNVSAYAGSGLGLAIVKAVIERQHGHVTVQTSASGTQFTLQLPTAA